MQDIRFPPFMSDYCCVDDSQCRMLGLFYAHRVCTTNALIDSHGSAAVKDCVCARVNVIAKYIRASCDLDASVCVIQVSANAHVGFITYG